jgi:predicted nucleotidyltransferase component of viral defense system
MIEITSDEVLVPELTMRGGTCIHKLHLSRALRYSEDLDYVRCTHTVISRGLIWLLAT